MLRNGSLQADFGSEMLICGCSEGKKHNLTCREMDDERLECVVVVVVVV